MEHARFAIRGATVRSESYNALFGRGCVQCDANAKLTCPPCKDGTQCAYTTQSCNQCPQAICQAVDGSDSGDGSSSGSDSGSKGPSAGPIAGGVIGGIAVIAIITFLVWKYLIKPKRGQYEQPSLYEAESSRGGGYVEKSDGHSHERRESVHTVHSIASTVLTRASNIIQIAYIPGVSNRATPTSQTPDVLVPPVPPIPAGRDDESEFSPYYARDSTYSGYSDRASSYNPRSSIASTIYGKQAQVQTASQAGMRIKPTVVSVKSGGSTPNTPPVPNIDFEKFSTPARPESTASNFSVGSTFVNTATQGRAQVVKVGGLKKIDIGPKSASPAPSSVTSPAKSSGKEASPIALSPIPTITETPPPEDSEQGPFADPPQKAPLGAIKEDTREGSSGSSSRASSAVSTPDRENGPFSDAHATK